MFDVDGCVKKLVPRSIAILMIHPWRKWVFSMVFSQNVSKGKGRVPSIYGTWRNTMNQRILGVFCLKHFPCTKKDAQNSTTIPKKHLRFHGKALAGLYSGDGDTGVNSGGGWLTVRGLTPRTSSHPKNELNWTKKDGRILPTKKKV